MRNYEKILKTLQDKKKSDFEVYNGSGGVPGADPMEALATMKAIGIYRRNPEFAECVRRYIHDEEKRRSGS